MKKTILARMRKARKAAKGDFKMMDSPSAVMSRFRQQQPRGGALAAQHCATCTKALPVRMVPTALAILTPARANMEAEDGTMLMNWRLTLPFSMN